MLRVLFAVARGSLISGCIAVAGGALAGGALFALSLLNKRGWLFVIIVFGVGGALQGGLGAWQSRSAK